MLPRQLQKHIAGSADAAVDAHDTARLHDRAEHLEYADADLQLVASPNRDAAAEALVPAPAATS